MEKIKKTIRLNIFPFQKHEIIMDERVQNVQDAK